MRLLVCGGAGFIGSNFIEYYLREHKDTEILCLDALTYAGNMENLESVCNDFRFTFVHGNICDRKLVWSLMERFVPDAVVNFAAESHVDRSIESPQLFLESNVQGVAVLLDACRHFSLRFHQISTDEVYGDLPLDEPELLFREESPLKPSSPYSASKASADLLTLSYYRTYGLPVTISRCSNNYGKHQHEEKLIPRMIRLALEDQPLPIYGSGLQVRDWIHVEDHCRAVDLILEKGRMGQIYNVGASCEWSNLELVHKILNELGKSPEQICHVQDRPGHDLRYALDWNKIERELGWQPQVSFEEGIRNCVHWYKKKLKKM